MKIAIAGAGRMGQAIAAIVEQQDDLELAGLWDRGGDLDALVSAADVVGRHVNELVEEGFIDASVTLKRSSIRIPMIHITSFWEQSNQIFSFSGIESFSSLKNLLSFFLPFIFETCFLKIIQCTPGKLIKEKI